MHLKVLLAALLFSWLLVIGCDENEHHTICFPPPEVGAVNIVVANDTIRFLPGDSASTTVTVIVSDRDGNVMEGIKINVSLNQTDLGFLEFLNPELRDTTNAQGRVELRFVATGSAGDVMITATVGSISASHLIAIRYSTNDPPTLAVSLSPSDTTAFQSDPVIIRVKVVVADETGVAVAGTNVLLSALEGILLPLPATNDSGIARTIWTLEAEEGVFILNARWGELVREVPVHIDIIDSSLIQSN